MANILNCRAIFLQIWKQQKAEAEAFGSRNIKPHSIDGLFESRKLENVKANNRVKCVQKKYFSYVLGQYGQYKASGQYKAKISYIFDSRHMNKVAAYFQE